MKNPTDKWVVPSLPVLKPCTDNSFCIMDLRGANRVAVPMVSSMSVLEEMCPSVGGSEEFLKMDVCHADWKYLCRQPLVRNCPFKRPLASMLQLAYQRYPGTLEVISILSPGTL